MLRISSYIFILITASYHSNILFAQNIKKPDWEQGQITLLDGEVKKGQLCYTANSKEVLFRQGPDQELVSYPNAALRGFEFRDKETYIQRYFGIYPNQKGKALVLEQLVIGKYCDYLVKTTKTLQPQYHLQLGSRAASQMVKYYDYYLFYKNQLVKVNNFSKEFKQVLKLYDVEINQLPTEVTQSYKTSLERGEAIFQLNEYLNKKYNPNLNGWVVEGKIH